MITKTKKKNWFRRHPVWTGIVCFFVLYIFIIGFFTGDKGANETTNSTSSESSTQQQQKQEALITKSLDEMLPAISDLPTEYSIGEKTEILKNSTTLTSRNAQEGFNSGKLLTISKIGGEIIVSYVGIDFGIYKFTSSKNASNFYNAVVNEVKSEGGYEKISLSLNAECFAWKEDYGFESKFGESICYNKNVVFWISVSMVNTYLNSESYVKDMTKIVDKKVE